MLVVAIVAGILAVIVLPIVAAITIPAFLNQRERAWQAELASAVRNAALEVEAAATQTGGRYDAIQDFDRMVTTELRRSSEAVELDTGSSLTGVHPGGFAICAEHRELDGSLAYVSDEGGLQEYRDTPCP